MSRTIRRILRSAPAEVLAEMEEHGWVLRMTQGNHVQWKHPSGAVVIGSSTPSDHRTWKNHLAELRRARSTPAAT